jgi:3'-5' exoribonuclease
LLNLRHLILSHHGEYEKASVRLPQTLEAVVLHHCDNLDAQTVGVAQLIESAPKNAIWTEYDKTNNRYYKIYRLSKNYVSNSYYCQCSKGNCVLIQTENTLCF